MMAGRSTKLLAISAFCFTSLFGCSQSSNTSSSVIGASDVHKLQDFTAADLLIAFKSTYGAPSPIFNIDANGEKTKLEPLKLIDIGSGLVVLVTQSTIPDGSHASQGSLSIFYLKKNGGGFELLSSHPAIGGEGGFGRPADWQLRTDLTTYPAIFTTKSDGGQGYFCTFHDLIELSPTGAKKVASGIVTDFDSRGALGDDAPNSHFVGELVPIEKEKRFDVKWSDSNKFIQHYKFAGEEYLAQSEAKFPHTSC